MISKELLSELLNIDDVVHIQKEGRNDLFISRWNNPAMIVNIDGLANKCKKWALEKEIDIVSGEQFAAFLIKDKQSNFYAGTEVEAVIKACEWILEEIKK